TAKNKGSNTNGNHRIRFLRKDLLGNEINILRTFSQSTHEIPVPIMAKRHIRTELVPFIGQLMLQLIPESVQHLKLKLLLGNTFSVRKLLHMINDAMVMRSNRRELPMNQMILYQLDKMLVNIMLILIGHIFRFLISPFHQTQTLVLVLTHIVFGTIKIRLYHRTDIIVCFQKLIKQIK